MEKETLHIEQFIPEFEEFVSNEEKHEFSKAYTNNKRKMLKKYRKDVLMSMRKRYMKVAIFVGVLVLVSPFVVNATTNGELFHRIWGNAGKEDVTSHEEILVDEEKGSELIVTYPEREYVEVNEERAQELIGDNVSYEPIVEQLGDTTLTILSTVYDGNSAVVEFTLEREGGVNALNYSQLDNESKGAWFSDESTFWFRFEGSGEHIYVDLEKSTPEKLYCYDYVGFKGTGSSLSLKIEEYPCERGVFLYDDTKYNEVMSDTIKRTVSIPRMEAAASHTFVNAAGGKIEISPMSMTIDRKVGLNLVNTYDPWEIYYVAVQYKDGSDYLVWEHEKYEYFDDGTKKLKHAAEVEIDNSSYALGRENDELLLVFNRLVDVEQIKAIVVNETVYTVSK